MRATHTIRAGQPERASGVGASQPELCHRLLQARPRAWPTIGRIRWGKPHEPGDLEVKTDWDSHERSVGPARGSYLALCACETAEGSRHFAVYKNFGTGPPGAFGSDRPLDVSPFQFNLMGFALVREKFKSRLN